MTRRTLLVLVLVAALGSVLAVPGAAAADTTLSVRDRVLHIDGDDGPNYIGLDTGGSPGVAVTDSAPGSEIVLGPGCGGSGCDPYDRLVIDLRGGDDVESDNGFTPPTTVIGGEGHDVLAPGSKRARLDGGPGDDRLEVVAYDAIAVMRGGPGDDRLETGARIATLDGGPGDDWLVGGLRLYGRGGRDLLQAVFAARLYGGADGDTILTGQRNDRVAGGAGADWIDAGAGGRDRIDCGSGRDRVLRADRRDRLRSCER